MELYTYRHCLGRYLSKFGIQNCKKSAIYTSQEVTDNLVPLIQLGGTCYDDDTHADLARVPLIGIEVVTSW